MGILGWIVFGLVVGAIAKLLMPGKDPGGIIVTMVLGVVGALLGGFIGRALVPNDAFEDMKGPMSWLVSISSTSTPPSTSP